MTENSIPAPTANAVDGPVKDHRAAWALAGAAAALPFLSELPIDVDRLAPLAVLPAVWLGRKIGRIETAETRATATDRWLLRVTVAAAVLSALLSAHPVPALVHTGSLAWILAGAFLARQLSADPTSTRLLLGGITLGATLGCLAVWIGWKEGTPISAFPYYGHGRLFGLHLMIGTMTALAWLSSTGPKTVERYVVTLIAIVNSGGMLWSGGRAPLIGFAAGVATWWWAAGAGRRRMLTQQVAIVFLGGLGLSLLRWSPEPYLGWWGAIARSAAATSVDELSSTRISFWQVTWHEFLKAPWLGHGADAYRFIQPKQDGSQPHNWVLQLLLDFGLFGGLALMALLLRRTWRGLRNNAGTVLHVGTTAGLVACLAAGLLDGIFYHAVLLVPAALLAGMAGNGDAICDLLRSPSPDRPRRIERNAAIFGLAGATALLATHACVVGAFLVGAPPRDSTTPAARLLQLFPSATFGLPRWLNGWRDTRPDEALAWAKWAQNHSDNPSELHVYAAVLYANRSNFTAASYEVGEALRKCHIRTRPKLLELQKAIAAAQMQAEPATPK